GKSYPEGSLSNQRECERQNGTAITLWNYPGVFKEFDLIL
ncbi:MAG: hypothetical protein, partial [Olavius algarvensis Delta 4 endosymbiont]